MTPFTFLRSGAACVLALACAWLLAGCVGPSEPTAQEQDAAESLPTHVQLAVPSVWGGQARCMDDTCRIALVDHKNSQLQVWQLTGRSAGLLAQHALAYHPDDAAWLDDTLVMAAVEISQSVDVLALRDGALQPLQQIALGFAPRRVQVLRRRGTEFELLATPYSGSTVARVRWNSATGQAHVSTSSWCDTPWHPVPVAQAPGQDGPGVAVACRGDRSVVWLAQDALEQTPVLLARFDAKPRRVAPSPSGHWLYVALETGGRNARLDMATGQVQYLPTTAERAVAVTPLADDLVIWGDSRLVYLQRIGADGSILETRWMRTSGFSTTLQLKDLDGDGELDLLVLNSAGNASDILYGPLWQNASTQEPGEDDHDRS